MDPERWRKIEKLYESIVERLPSPLPLGSRCKYSRRGFQ
jgi:hypothetical protein